MKYVKELTAGINEVFDSIRSQTELDGVRALADAGPVLALVPPLARAVANGEQWSRISGSVSCFASLS